MPTACSGPTWFSQISSPVFASSACRMLQRVHEIHDPVVHERHRLVRAAFLHRPHPRELQILHVGARDFVERAVAPALIVAAHHQPVAGIRIAQHRVGDRHVVLHLAGDGDAPAQPLRARPPRPPPPPSASSPSPVHGRPAPGRDRHHQVPVRERQRLVRVRQRLGPPLARRPARGPLQCLLSRRRSPAQRPARQASHHSTAGRTPRCAA